MRSARETCAKVCVMCARRYNSSKVTKAGAYVCICACVCMRVTDSLRLASTLYISLCAKSYIMCISARPRAHIVSRDLPTYICSPPIYIYIYRYASAKDIGCVRALNALYTVYIRICVRTQARTRSAKYT